MVCLSASCSGFLLSGLRIQSFYKEPDQAFSLLGFHDSVIFAYNFSSLKSLFYCREKIRRRLNCPFCIISSIRDLCMPWHFGTIQMWMRILASVRLTNVFSSGSCSFCQLPSRHEHQWLFSQFICLFLLKGIFTLFFKDKKWLNSTGRNQGFSSLFCLLMERSVSSARSVQINFWSGSGSRKPNLRLTCT